MSDFKQGDRVNVTIEGARVIAYGYDERYRCDYVLVAQTIDGKEAHPRIFLGADGVEVEHADPAWWPPRPGDLLHDGSGVTRFAVACGSNIVLMSPYGEQIQPQESWEQRHDLKLVHREDEQGGGAR